MAEALAKAELRAPLVPVVANVTAAKATDPAEIRELLVRPGDRHWRGANASPPGRDGLRHFFELGGQGCHRPDEAQRPGARAGDRTPADFEAF